MNMRMWLTSEAKIYVVAVVRVQRDEVASMVVKTFGPHHTAWWVGRVEGESANDSNLYYRYKLWI
jgi:hypothetical protein